MQGISPTPMSTPFASSEIKEVRTLGNNKGSGMDETNVE